MCLWKEMVGGKEIQFRQNLDDIEDVYVCSFFNFEEIITFCVFFSSPFTLYLYFQFDSYTIVYDNKNNKKGKIYSIQRI